MILLKLIWKGNRVKEYSITQEQAVIGRLDNCDIVVSDAGVSRFHALIDYQDSSYLLVDTSEQGTLLNNNKITTARIKEGDVIQISNFRLEVVTITKPDLASLKIEQTLPFSEDMSQEDVELVLRHVPFKSIDSSAFPADRKIRDIISNDSRIVRYKNGDIIVRESDFGTTAFFILEGSVWYFLESLPSQLLGRKTRRRKNWLELFLQYWRKNATPEYRDPKRLRLDSRLGKRKNSRSRTQVYIQDTEKVTSSHKSTLLSVGEIFGEISALGRTPRPATVVSKGETTVLEMRWQGLQDLRSYSHEIKEMLESLYRARSLEKHIRETDLFKDLNEEELRSLSQETLFKTFGNFDWRSTYLGDEENLDEPLIAKEGDYVNGLILIRSGFAKVTARINEGAKTVRYLSRGDIFGFSEISHNWKTGEQVPFRETLQAIGYADTLMVPVPVLENFVLSKLDKNELPDLIEDKKAKRKESSQVDPGLLDFLVSNRFYNGRSIMMIDLDRCTRCNDCVTACASAHDNNPRFIRDGKQYEQYLVAHSCMHCSDPVCMIGCPTGAIHRDSDGGEIVINEVSCIGCSICADSCPYDNIQMVNIRKNDSEFLLDEETGKPIMKATKCDLCVDQLSGPACERSCPTDALKRVDLSDFDSLVEWGKRGE